MGIKFLRYNSPSRTTQKLLNYSSKKGLGWRSVAAHKKSLEVGLVQRTATISERCVAEIKLNKINALY